ncbi:DUF378 domain-containing protein [Halorussus litoreus]|uniref:DUF378 domain-containing protein n=1 Tax=Halorussus litoreus TaxID=1710536 RepID=UPI0013001A7D|nr:DUF378 domain-containing protein [Halorussus litoreus]
MNTNFLDWLAIVLVVVGAVTWGILGVTGLTGDPVNVVNVVLDPIFQPGPAETVEYLIYVLVGASGIYLLYTASKMARASRRATRERRRRDATRTDSRTDQSDAGTDNTES